jgi:predicted DNA-binding protein (MmcQ/YjbR family)
VTSTSFKKAESVLRRYALAFPGAVEEFPWGERVIKVRGKIFVFLGIVQGGLRVTVKLPISSEMALTLPYVERTGYGLGRSGWVTARFDGRRKPPVDLLQDWIEQSYRAVAPKKLAEQLKNGGPIGRRSRRR